MASNRLRITTPAAGLLLGGLLSAAVPPFAAQARAAAAWAGAGAQPETQPERQPETQPETQAEPEREERAMEVLRAARDAVEALEGLAYNVTLGGEGSGPLAGLTPTGEGQVRMVRAEIPGLGGTWHRRVTGQVTEARSGRTPIDLLRAPKFDEWADEESETVVRRPTSRRPPVSQASYRLLMIGEMMGGEPFSAELNGVSVRHEGEAEVDGTACDVIRVEYDPNDRARLSTTIPSVVAVWSIARDDRLPRRIERINEGGGISLTIVQELSDVRSDPGLSPEDLRLDVPEGWTLDDRLARERARRRPPPSQDKDRARQIAEERRGRAQREGQEDTRPDRDAMDAAAESGQTESYEAAPDFEFIDPEGETIDNAEIEGRVTVLYFWGTWSATARDYSPLIGELAEKYKDRPVSVYGPVVNQRRRSAVLQAVEENGYAFTPLFGTGGRGVGADDVARAMGVRFFPTVFVLDGRGRIRLKEAAGRDADPKSVADKVDEAISAALEDLGD